MALVGLSGEPLVAAKPAPSPATEKVVNEELAKLDSLLFIRWIPTAYWGGRNPPEGRYALCCWWAQADKRWEWVRCGKHDPQEAIDRFGWFCEDMQNAGSVPLDSGSILRKALEILYACDNTRFPITTRMAQIIEKNAKVHETTKKESLLLVQEAAEDRYDHHMAVRSFGGIDKSPTKEA